MCACVQVEFFEPFWDSGEERVGELGARGWKAWMLQQERGGWLQPSAGKTLRHPYNRSEAGFTLLSVDVNPGIIFKLFVGLKFLFLIFF